MGGDDVARVSDCSLIKSQKSLAEALRTQRLMNVQLERFAAIGVIVSDRGVSVCSAASAPLRETASASDIK